MDELHGHRSLADCRGATLEGSGADVAGGENAGDARLEQAGDSGRLTSEDETVLVPRNRFAQPLGARPRSEEDEQERERDGLAARKRDCLEGSPGSVELGNLAASGENRHHGQAGGGADFVERVEVEWIRRSDNESCQICRASMKH